MSKKKYDPLWELLDEKVALQGMEPDVDAKCPYCHVTVHLGLKVEPGAQLECGLCGGVSEVIEEAGALILRAVEDTPFGQ